MLSDVWTALTTSASSVVSWLTSLFSGLAKIFYEPATTTGGSGSLTFVGVFAIIALTVTVAFIAIKWLSSFITLNRN